MEFMAEFTEGMSRDRARQIIKGKRTKRRHRYPSPSTTSGNGEYCSIDDQFTPSDSSTEEDEDMANCLILLAQSVSPEENFKSDDIQLLRRQKTERLSSRRLNEIVAGGKPDLYAYECKTCNRTFPSFQALGGHRASHKKPKLNVEEKKSGSAVNCNNFQPPLIDEFVNEDHDQHRSVIVEDEENKANIIVSSNNVQKSSSSPSRSSSTNFLQPAGVINSNNIRGGKVHECSICGSEFLSGQALGGHMRKHRPIPPSGNRITVASIVNTDDHRSSDLIIEKSPETTTRMLSLDLNFPPPEELKSYSSSSSSQQQQHLVFSAPAFVDCHY